MKEHSLLDSILEPGGLSVVFQPIFEVADGARKIHALECLTRGPRGTNMESAGILFEYVRRKREETLVDRSCIAVALSCAREFPADLNLCVNVHASTLSRDRDFVGFLIEKAEMNGINPSRLIMEIVEHAPPWDIPTFNQALNELREAGVRIALDDIGLGNSNYRMLLDCLPEYFKIDRYLVSGSHTDYYRRAVLQSIVELATKFGSHVVAEGVETQADFDSVRTLGVELVQGYFLCREMNSERIMESAMSGKMVLPSVAASVHLN